MSLHVGVPHGSILGQIDDSEPDTEISRQYNFKWNCYAIDTQVYMTLSHKYLHEQQHVGS